jgi:hypothetical protein
LDRALACHKAPARNNTNTETTQTYFHTLGGIQISQRQYVPLPVQSGTFPDMLKISKIKPIPKGGDKRDILNYRQISILSLFSKILEKIMCKRLNSYIEKNNKNAIWIQTRKICGMPAKHS